MSDEYTGPIQGDALLNLSKRIGIARKMEIRKMPKSLADGYIREYFADYTPDEQDYIRHIFGSRLQSFDPQTKDTDNFFYAALHTAGCSNIRLAKFRGTRPQSMHGMIQRAYSRYGLPWKEKNFADHWTDDMIGVAKQEYDRMLEENPLLNRVWGLAELGEHLLNLADKALEDDTTPDVPVTAPVVVAPGTVIRQTDTEEVIVEGINDASPQSMEEAMRQMRENREKLSNE